MKKVNKTQEALSWWCKLEFNEHGNLCKEYTGHLNDAQLSNADIKKIWNLKVNNRLIL